jgi:hypothetical protein
LARIRRISRSLTSASGLAMAEKPPLIQPMNVRNGPPAADPRAAKSPDHFMQRHPVVRSRQIGTGALRQR